MGSYLLLAFIAFLQCELRCEGRNCMWRLRVCALLVYCTSFRTKKCESGTISFYDPSGCQESTEKKRMRESTFSFSYKKSSRTYVF